MDRAARAPWAAVRYVDPNDSSPEHLCAVSFESNPRCGGRGSIIARICGAPPTVVPGVCRSPPSDSLQVASLTTHRTAPHRSAIARAEVSAPPCMPSPRPHRARSPKRTTADRSFSRAPRSPHANASHSRSHMRTRRERPLVIAALQHARPMSRRQRRRGAKLHALACSDRQGLLQVEHLLGAMPPARTSRRCLHVLARGGQTSYIIRLEGDRLLARRHGLVH